MKEPSKRRREIDLTSLARSLELEGEHLDLTKKIKQTVSVASAHQDLQMARDAMMELRDLVQDGPDEKNSIERRGRFAAALFAHAIVLYARATETSPIDRWKWFGREMLTKGQRQWHKQVMEHRDKVLVHFGHGVGQSEGPAVRFALIMREPQPPSNELEVAFLETRANTRSSLSAKLLLLLDATIVLARDAFDARLQELNAELNTAAHEDSRLAPTAQTHAFDRASFFDDAADIDLIGSDEKSHHYFKSGQRVID